MIWEAKIWSFRREEERVLERCQEESERLSVGELEEDKPDSWEDRRRKQGPYRLPPSFGLVGYCSAGGRHSWEEIYEAEIKEWWQQVTGAVGGHEKTEHAYG
jgi:hypothetical protein